MILSLASQIKRAYLEFQTPKVRFLSKSCMRCYESFSQMWTIQIRAAFVSFKTKEASSVVRDTERQVGDRLNCSLRNIQRCRADITKAVHYELCYKLIPRHERIKAREFNLAGLPTREPSWNGVVLTKNLPSLDNITTLHQRLSEAENKIEQLKTSLSWRITEPLRFVRDRLVSAVWRVRKAISKGPVRAPAPNLPESSRGIIAPLFDEAYYTSLNPEANASDRSPVDHYIERGWKEGLKPHPLFDPAWYLKENPEVAKAGVEPLHHYMTSGWRDGRSPHPLFDVRYYLNKAPEL
jgi:hypothetical protein